MILNLQLFNNTYTDNHNRIGKFNNLTEQENYFNNLPKITMDGNFNKIGDGIVITGDYSSMAGYNYGRFRYHDFWYYFSVIDYRVINETKLQIEYSLDYYETARFQFDMFIGKGTINNITSEYDVIKKIPKEYNGLGKRKETVVWNSFMAGLILYVHRSSDDTNNIYYLHDSMINFFNKIIKNNVFDILIDNNLIDTYDDIRGCWLLPAMFYGIISSHPNDWEEPIQNNNEVQRYKGNSADNLGGTITIHLKRTDEEYTIFKDSRGMEIWQVPNGYYMDEDKVLTYRLDISVNSCVMKILTDSDNVNRDTIISLPLETVDVFNDAFTEYNTRQRFADIENRKISNEQQLSSGLINIGGTITQGAVSGAMVGGPIGAAVGAGIGTVGSLAGSIGGYFLNDYYGNRQQDILDKQYTNAFDNLLLQGNGISCFYTSYFKCGFYNVKYETDLGYPRIEKALETYGYEVNQHYPNVQNYINYLMSLSGEDYLRGNFEINGHIPDNWKQKIKERFNGGVTFG